MSSALEVTDWSHSLFTGRILTFKSPVPQIAMFSKFISWYWLIHTYFHSFVLSILHYRRSFQPNRFLGYCRSLLYIDQLQKVRVKTVNFVAESFRVVHQNLTLLNLFLFLFYIRYTFTHKIFTNFNQYIIVMFTFLWRNLGYTTILVHQLELKLCKVTYSGIYLQCIQHYRYKNQKSRFLYCCRFYPYTYQLQ